MKQFKVGKTYGAYDLVTPAIKIIKRTSKACLVEDTITGDRWRMKIKILANIYDRDEYEEMTDVTVPVSLRKCYTYSTKFEKRN